MRPANDLSVRDRLKMSIMLCAVVAVGAVKATLEWVYGLWRSTVDKVHSWWNEKD